MAAEKSAHDSGHAGTQAPGGAHPPEGSFPPFDTTHFASQLLWLAITFGLLYVLMSKIALPRIANILERRAAKIASDLDAARAAQTQAEAAQKQHEKTLADARAAAQATGQAAQAAVVAETEAKRKVLDNELQAKIAAAEAQIAQTKASAMTNVEAIARDAASAIIQQLTGRTADAQAITAAVASAAKSS